MKRHNLRADLHAALDKLRDADSNAYAQFLLLPFGPIPAYAEDDPNGAWWFSDEAQQRLAQLREATEGSV